MNIKITADSTCDLSDELLEKYDITIIPLQVIKDGKVFTDGEDITPADIFSHVAAGGDLCTTSAVNEAHYHEVFSGFSKEYDAVVHINIGAGFSSCYQNACNAAKDFDNVYVIDSNNLSTGHGHIVLEAAVMSQNCEDIDSMCRYLRELTPRVETSFILDRLDYMVKGGRCSMVTALGANLLKLKPCIEVINGNMKVVKKYRGNYAKCLGSYIKDRLHERDDIVRENIFITYTPVSEDNLNVARNAVETYGNFKSVIETHAGCTVSCHCGPGTLGVLFIRKEDAQ